MNIYRYVSNLMASNMYIIVEDGHAIVIDPSIEFMKLVKINNERQINNSNNDNTSKDEYGYIEGINDILFDKIILTHEHYDHIAGVNDWKKNTSSKTICSRSCAENLGDTKKNLSRHFKEFCELQTWMKIDSVVEYDKNYMCSADVTFEDKMSFNWMSHEFGLFEIPGHSQGSIGVLVDGECYFSGDSLLHGVDIEFRLPGGSRSMWESVGKKRIEALKKGIKVFPGHLETFVLD